jgi:hypothetical protein
MPDFTVSDIVAFLAGALVLVFAVVMAISDYLPNNNSKDQVKGSGARSIARYLHVIAQGHRIWHVMCPSRFTPGQSVTLPLSITRLVFLMRI